LDGARADAAAGYETVRASGASDTRWRGARALKYGAMTDEQARAIASTLQAQHRDRARFMPVTNAAQPLTLQDAYQVQRCHVQALCRDNSCGVAGYKIGLTSAAMQQMCGIAHPVYGCVLQDRVAQGTHEVSLAAAGRLGVEFEIAARLGKDLKLSPGDDPLQAAADAVDAVAVALELVDDRSADYATLDAPSLIADNAWNAAVVLGPWVPVFAELAGWPGELLLDGKPVDEGVVGSGPAHPLSSVAWLAQQLSEEGRVLQRGTFVMTGSIVRTRFPAAGERWRFQAERLGAVDLVVNP
jgi:2-keto-4-pentenoate hydratase